ncbi:MAG: crotonase/enoyl-CoA hydratase family protein [Pseudomonadales bacterium]|nr:crotonase/enoyl-CoA hydratase family protein [Pseudomonadales bacterium]
MTNLVTIDIQDQIADVRLNRPDKMNALSMPMFDAIVAAGKQLQKNTQVRAVVLSGEGRSFCAGMDLANFTDSNNMADPFGDGKGGAWPNFYQLPAFVWKAIPVPVICALHGVTYGGGAQIALGADIRIANPDLKMSIMEIKWGLIPDMSASQTLRDLVRLDIAKELTFTGRVVGGEEALQIGLVTSLSDTPRETALEMAAGIAARNPNAIMLGKHLLDNTWHGDQLEGLRMEERLQAKILKSHNQIEAVMAGMQKREANYNDRDMVDFDSVDLD